MQTHERSYPTWYGDRIKGQLCCRSGDADVDTHLTINIMEDGSELERSIESGVRKCLLLIDKVDEIAGMFG